MNQYYPIPNSSILAATMPYSPIAYIPGKAELRPIFVPTLTALNLAAMPVPQVPIP